MCNIPVFLSSDNNYAPYVATTIASICDNTSSFIDFYVLDSNISAINKRKIENLKNNFKNFSIEYINVNLDKYFDNFKETQYISKSMYGRFLIPDLKPNLKRVIYSDVDIIAKGDIKEFFDEDIKGYTIGAVWEEYAEGTFNKERKQRLNLSAHHKYFSSGILLIDCDKWKKENTVIKLFEIEKNNKDKLKCPDMDILNILFDNNYKPLSSKYCYINQNYNFYKEHNVLIRHYNGQIKPWHINADEQKTILEDFKIFWRYAKMTDFFEELDKKSRDLSDTKVRLAKAQNMLLKCTNKG